MHFLICYLVCFRSEQPALEDFKVLQIFQLTVEFVDENRFKHSFRQGDVSHLKTIICHHIHCILSSRTAVFIDDADFQQIALQVVRRFIVFFLDTVDPSVRDSSMFCCSLVSQIYTHFHILQNY